MDRALNIMMKVDRALNITIPESLYRRIKNEAQDKSVSMAAMVRLICLEYFERAERNPRP